MVIVQVDKPLFSATKYIHDEISMEAEYCVVNLSAVLYICSLVIITSYEPLVLLGANCILFLAWFTRYSC